MYDQNGGFYSTTKNYGYIKKDNITEGYKFWLGLLNSSLFWFFIQQTGYVLRGGYFTFKTNYISPFPVPSDLPQKLVQRVEERVTDILKIREKSQQEDTCILESEIDQIIYQLYSLSESEIKIIESNNGVK